MCQTALAGIDTFDMLLWLLNCFFVTLLYIVRNDSLSLSQEFRYSVMASVSDAFFYGIHRLLLFLEEKFLRYYPIKNILSPEKIF